VGAAPLNQPALRLAAVPAPEPPSIPATLIIA
jgi:hypothetical protein